MSRILGLILVLVCLATGIAQAAVSPQDRYLQIYLLIQEADKLEISGQKASARERYQVSLERLKRLQSDYSDWEPTIVKYRLRYCEEKAGKLEGATNANPDMVAPPIPPDLADAPSAPSLPSAPPPSSSTPSSTGAPVVDSGDAAMPSTVTVSPVPSLTGDGAVPSTGTDSLPSTGSGPGVPESADAGVLKARIRELEGQLADMTEKYNAASTEVAKLRTKVSELEIALKTAREGTTDEQIKQLLEENKTLRQKLDTAEQLMAQFSGGAGGDNVVKIQGQLDRIQEQLSLKEKENEALRQTNEEFKQQLQKAQEDLAAASDRLKKYEGPNSPLTKENAMLRDIVQRQLREQARRDAAKRLAMEELQTLKIESTTLKTQLDLLGSPLVELTETEKSMLRAPVVGGTDGNFFANAPEAASSDFSTSPRVPEEFKETATEATQLFEQQDFDGAAAKYQSILNTYPKSLYALSNLAVVRFQQGNYPEAEKALRQAVLIAPQDAFCHSVLGIVLYQEGKYDEAVQILSRAVALDGNDPKTRNYLGIAASQKGWQEAAEQECRKAIDLDPNYGDAHFNLAVIYSTQKPPSKELARRHYEKALGLGVPADPQLEKMIDYQAKR